MPNERAKLAANLIWRKQQELGCGMTPYALAGLIDAAAGLPELEARVAELERENASLAEDVADRMRRQEEAASERDAIQARVAELELELIQRQSSLGQEIRRLEISHDEVNRMRDALAKRLAAVVDYAAEWSGITGDDPNAQVIRPLASAVLRLARGEEE